MKTGTRESELDDWRLARGFEVKQLQPLRTIIFCHKVYSAEKQVLDQWNSMHSLSKMGSLVRRRSSL